MIGKLEIRLLNYFLLIVTAALLIGAEFYFEMGGSELNQEIRAVAAKLADTDEVLPQLNDLRKKILIMFGLLTVVVAIVLTMFIKNITMPLCKMVAVAKHINEGDLSQVVPVEMNDEIGEVGSAINELTSNLQEVATFTAATSNETLQKIESLKGQSASDEQIDEIKESLQSLVDFVNAFKLLHTDIK